ncbi:MAG: sensor histidine kinase [Burkholderiales bacterium]
MPDARRVFSGVSNQKPSLQLADVSDRCADTTTPTGFRSFFELLNVPILWFEQSTIVDVNAACCSWLRYSTEHLLNAPLTLLVPNAERRNPDSAWRTITGHKLLVNATVPVRDATGGTREAIASTFRQFPDTGEAGLLLLRPARNADAYASDALDCGKQAELAYDLAVIDARERRRIANGLHDEIGQVLAIIGLKLAALGTTSSADEIAMQVKELLSFVSQAQQATRSATFELSCPVLEHLGLQAAIEALAERLDGLAGLSIQIRGSVPAVPIPEPVGQVLFRVVRELLVNAIKHSRATQATIEISMQGNDLTFTVQDDGVGIHSLDTRAAAHCDGFGLQNVEAQVLAIGGRLTLLRSAQATKGTPSIQGTQIEIAIPLSQAVAFDHTH